MKIVLLALLVASNIVKGVVEISPSVVAPVCQAGDQLELTCSVSGVFLRWEFTVILEDGRSSTFMPVVTAGGDSGVPPPRMANSTTFTFSRLSTQPLTSTMTISNVSEGLNGVQINCVEVETSESATTTIRIVDARDALISRLNIHSHSAQPMSDRITITLEWAVVLSQISYQHLLENIIINVIPDPEVTIVYTGNRTLQLTLAYNTLYNVSLTQPGICGQPNQRAFIELSYSKCSNPLKLVHTDVITVDYDDPALEGDSITFICPTGAILSGPNSSTCMGNGEWEPDPREVNCTSVLYKTTGTTVSRVPTPSHVTTTTTTTVMLRTALISVTCVLVMMSVVTFVIGFICGHCFSPRWRKSANKNSGSPSDPTTEPGEDLELKENVAYITIHQK